MRIRSSEDDSLRSFRVLRERHFANELSCLCEQKLQAFSGFGIILMSVCSRVPLRQRFVHLLSARSQGDGGAFLVCFFDESSKQYRVDVSDFLLWYLR